MRRVDDLVCSGSVERSVDNTDGVDVVDVDGGFVDGGGGGGLMLFNELTKAETSGGGFSLLGGEEAGEISPGGDNESMLSMPLSLAWSNTSDEATDGGARFW